jgi:NADPH2:quinone reductase
MKGLYNIKLKYPFTPGWEGSGTVIEVGPGLLSSYFKDKRVAFNKQFELGTYSIGGAFAEYCVTDVRSCIPLNDSISLE